MAVAFGVLSLAPATFWSMTLKELEAAIRGRIGPRGHAQLPSRGEVSSLIAQYPD